jgi:hypothetical protein
MFLPLELAVPVGEGATLPETAETRQFPVPTHLQKNSMSKDDKVTSVLYLTMKD